MAPRPAVIAGSRCFLKGAIRAGAAPGVTLIELLITLSLVTVLLTMGVAGMSRLVTDNRRTTEVNALIGNLNYARAEAVQRATNVIVCPIDPDALPAEPEDPCVVIKAPDGDRQWAQGYAVLVEETGERLRIQPPSQGVTIETASVNQIRFRDDGSGTNRTFKVCDRLDAAADAASRKEDVVAPRAVIISRVGRVRAADQAPSGDIDCS